MGNIKNKIYRKVTDFVGNYIKNVKTDTPVNEDDVSNKKYVDNQTTYDTALSRTDSTKFSWMKNMHNKSLKEIVDMLLFPQNTENHVNPNLIECHIQLLDNISGDNETIINTGNTVKLRFLFELSPTKRLSNELPKIIFTDNNNQTTIFQLQPAEFNVDTLIGVKIIEIDMLSIKKVELQRQYEAITGVNGFDTSYLLNVDLLPTIKNKFYIFEPIYSYKIPDNDISDLYKFDDKIQRFENYILPKLNQFQKGNKISVDNNKLNRYAFLFVLDNITNCNIETIVKSRLNRRIITRNTYSYDNLQIRFVKQKQNIQSQINDLIFTNLTSTSNFVIAYWEFGNLQQDCDIFITYDKVFYHKI